ncbi:hypothetical protein [Paenibacillus sp. 481]|uniref:hypothetical protein n=1 Tax=Paenibacillus sp. 481 TaxID=2835869 RepID=UPI001E585D4D|nr:hypothetical protein [Paenibacillus sp. 481]UHA75247.1 hypothetical protein KIK04_09675 [Paenibacillus sp. 481]
MGILFQIVQTCQSAQPHEWSQMSRVVQSLVYDRQLNSASFQFAASKGWITDPRAQLQHQEADQEDINGAAST